MKRAHIIDYDVVVVGAGPSGAAAAKGLTSAGFNVLILEKKPLPRYKICSGIIFKKSQDITEKYFGKIPDSAFVKPQYLSGVRLWTNSKNFNDWPFDTGGAPNVWRAEYDYWLIKNSNAVVKDHCELKRFKDLGTHVKLEYLNKQNNEIVQITCKYLISAEGSLSTIRKTLSPAFEKSLSWFIAYQNYYEGASTLDPLFYHGFLEPQYGDVYAWFSMKDGLQVFGTAVRKGMRILPYLNVYKKMLKNKFGLSLKKLVRESSCLGNNMSSTDRFFLGNGNVLVVGEAAGFLNAFGEGISCALSTGLFAAEAISNAFKSGSNALSIYNGLTKQERRRTQASWMLGARIAGRELLS